MASNISETNELKLHKKLDNNGTATLFNKHDKVNGKELLGGGNKNESFNISENKDRPTPCCSSTRNSLCFENQSTPGNSDNSMITLTIKSENKLKPHNNYLIYEQTENLNAASEEGIASSLNIEETPTNIDSKENENFILDKSGSSYSKTRGEDVTDSTKQPEKLPVQTNSEIIEEVEDKKNKNVQYAQIELLPAIVLENIFQNLSSREISNNIRHTCSTFEMVAERILRVEFKSILPRIKKATEQMIIDLKDNDKQMLKGFSFYKILECEMLMLRVACARQVESSLCCFRFGKTIDKYNELINKIQAQEIRPIVDEFNKIINELNEVALKYFDDRYNDPFTLNNMKFLGIEIIEILNIAMNLSANITVIYNTDNEEGSCIIIGQFSVLHCPRLEIPFMKTCPPPICRQTILTYLRILTRVNNSDVIFRKIHHWNSIINKNDKITHPLIPQKKWRLHDRLHINRDHVQEVHKKEAVEEPSGIMRAEDYFDSNMRMECNFELMCPKSAKPLDIKFVTTRDIEQEKVSMETKFQHSGEESRKDNYNCSFSTDNTHQEQNQIFQIWKGDQALSVLQDEAYCFRMTLKMVCPRSMARRNTNKLITLSETYTIEDSGKEECLLEILDIL